MNSSDFTWKRGEHMALSPHFTTTEMTCDCGKCVDQICSHELILKLEVIRNAVGKPVVIIEAFRCADRQRELRNLGYKTSVGPSQHEYGRAADILVRGISGLEMERIARQAGFKAVGVAQSWIHVDTRYDKDLRRWVY